MLNNVSWNHFFCAIKNLIRNDGKKPVLQFCACLIVDNNAEEYPGESDNNWSYMECKSLNAYADIHNNSASQRRKNFDHDFEDGKFKIFDDHILHNVRLLVLTTNLQEWSKSLSRGS